MNQPTNQHGQITQPNKQTKLRIPGCKQPDDQRASQERERVRVRACMRMFIFILLLLYISCPLCKRERKKNEEEKKNIPNGY